MYAAYCLHKAGIDFDLFEARDRLGGRIHSAEAGLDLGSTWFWPDFQPHIHGLVGALGLRTFAQYDQGDVLIERGLGQVVRHQGYRSGNQSVRIEGGTTRLIDALAAHLPTDCIRLNTEVLAASLGESVVTPRPDAISCVTPLTE